VGGLARSQRAPQHARQSLQRTSVMLACAGARAKNFFTLKGWQHDMAWL